MQDKEKDRINGIAEKTDEGLPVGIGERISYLRRRACLTQAQLAEQLGISAQAVSKWESGLSCPDIMMLLPLAGIFNVSTDVLLGGSAMADEGTAVAETDAGEKQTKSEAEAEAIKMVKVAAKAIEEEGRNESVKHTWDEEQRSEQEQDQNEAQCEEKNKQFYKPPKKIHSLQLDLGMAEAFIREGSEFSLTLTGFDTSDCSSTVENGVWKICDRGHRDFIFGIRNFFRGKKAIITVPAGYHFREVQLSMGAGTITGEHITADSCMLNVGAGQITMLNLCSGNTDLECGMGEIKIGGVLTGRCRMECGMGNITANLAAQDHYGYDVSVGMGEVKIGENSFGGMGGHYKINASAENFFNINCSMGTVGIRFSPRR